jgi:hypothetical protein
MSFRTIADEAFDITEEYDPLSVNDEIEETEEEAYSAVEELREESLQAAKPELSVYERTQSLFESMKPRAATLKGMVLFCETPQSAESLNEEVERLAEFSASVYSPATLSNLLEKAGALQRVTESGEPYPAEVPEPELVEIDGQAFYETPEMPAVYWVAHPEALTYLEDVAPASALAALFAEDAKYAEVYEILFDLMKAPEGATMPQLSEAVDNLEVMKKPRIYAPRFLDKLEALEAIEWKGAWHATPLGIETFEQAVRA